MLAVIPSGVLSRRAQGDATVVFFGYPQPHHNVPRSAGTFFSSSACLLRIYECLPSIPLIAQEAVLIIQQTQAK